MVRDPARTVGVFIALGFTATAKGGEDKAQAKDTDEGADLDRVLAEMLHVYLVTRRVWSVVILPLW